MSTSTVNIAFKNDLLREIDALAEKESRSRSEFLREAARVYIERKRRWSNIFTMGREVAEANSLTPVDVSREIHAYRKGKAKTR